MIKRVVHVYVGGDGKKLDLFDDEDISVTSSGQSLIDLTGTLADFSQTFTVPASDANNEIFEHYYNNDVDGVIDHNLRRESRIEVDFIQFRTGKLQLEKGTVDEGKAQDYTATFYGDVVTLKDKIGEATLSDLDYSSLNHSYTSTEVVNRINGTTDDEVKYPLISSDRVWTYSSGGGGGSENIANIGTGIDFEELNPAVYLYAIFDLIQSEFGVTFIGSWLNTDRFRKLLLWFKNSEQFVYTSQPYDIFNDNDENFDNGYIFGTVHYTYRVPSSLPTTGAFVNNVNIMHNVNVTVNTASTSTYYLDVYKNGVKISSLFHGGGNKIFNIVQNQTNGQGINEFYSFKIRSTAVATFTGSLDYFINYVSYDSFFASVSNSVSYTNPFESITTAIDTNLEALCPEMKVLDLIRGVAKFAKMVLVSIDENTYKFMPIDDYYNSGKIQNITEYVNEESITVNRPELYKKIELKYKESKSLINTQFFNANSRRYGDVTQTFDYDGGEYKVELPFELIVGQKFAGSNLHVAYCLDSSLKPYVPNPVLLYERPLQSGESFYVDSSNVTSYIPFGQDVIIGANTYTSNFNIEVSSFSLNPEPNSLYNTYYEGTLSNLYNLKTRVYNVDVVFPINILTDIELNDYIIIRDKAYIILDMVNNLTTGECRLNLISWFDIVSFGGNFPVEPNGGVLVVGLDVGGGSVLTLTEPESAFTTITQTDLGNGVIMLSVDYSLNDTSPRSDYYQVRVTRSDGTILNDILGFTQETI